MGKQKIFGIGQNKTGTTSLKTAIQELGYKVGSQRIAKLLVRDWAVRDFNRIVEYFHSAYFFQNVPFATEGTYQKLCSFLGVDPVGNSFPWENKTSDIHA